MRRIGIALSIFSVILLPALVSAATFSGNSRTYLAAREAFDDSNFMPLYEYLDFNLDEIGSSDVSFHFGGWGRIALRDKDEAFGNRNLDGDVQYAYLSFRNKTSNAVVNLGRVLVFEGVASEIVDGISAKTDLKYGLGVSAYVGNPVQTGYFDHDTDLIYGARLTQGDPNLYRIGASFLKEDGNSSSRREEEGADLWVMPAKNFQIVGRSSYNSRTGGWMEHDYRVVAGPFQNFTFTPFLSWISYSDYFTSTSSSAFIFNPATNGIDPKDKALILGGQADYFVFKQVTVSADYRHFDYDLSGNSNYYGGKLSYHVPFFTSGGVGVGYHRMSGDSDELKYNEYRAFAYEKRDKADVTLDLLVLSYDDAVNGVKTATTVALAAGYDLTKAARIAADVEYSKNPYYRKDWRGLLQFIYHFDLAQAGKKGGYNK